MVEDATVDAAGINEPSAPYSLRLNGHPSGGDVVESATIDLSAYPRATLTYCYQQTGEGKSPGENDDLIIEYYSGSGWVELDRQLGSGPDMTVFERRILNVPADALRSRLKLRMRSIGPQTAARAPNSWDDWFVDDVRIVGEEPNDTDVEPTGPIPLPEDLVEVTQSPSLEGLAAGSQEAQEQQRQAVQWLRLPLEVHTRTTGIVFRLIPAGTFTMGSPTSESQRNNDESQHHVTLTKPYYCGKFEVTQAQWQQVMGSNPSYFKTAGLDAPVEQVTWEDCQTFVKKLCQLEQVPEGTYRLLTEAEWEYACRAGTVTALCYGDDLDASMANFSGSYPYGQGVQGQYRATTVSVGSFPPNGWGLYDMHGNVYERCQDWYGTYPDRSQNDPPGPPSGTGRVLRGGCWRRIGAYCRSADRGSSVPGGADNLVGLRIARTVPSYPVRMVSTPVFEDAFPSTVVDAAKWIVVKGATVDGVGIDEPSAPYSLRLNGYPSGGDTVESRIIDLSMYSQATLTYFYQRTGGGGAPGNGEDLLVEYHNGFTWVELDRQMGAGSDMTTFEGQTISLPPGALCASFALRMRNSSIGARIRNPNVADWFVDDVRIAGEEPMEISSLPDDLRVGGTQYASWEGLAAGSEEARARQRQALQQLRLPLEVRTRETGILFCLIPAGAFTMGSPANEAGRTSGESPHGVTLTLPFYCGKFEVTQGQWQQVMGSNPSSLKSVGQDAPVERVTWDECQAFVQKLCQLEGVPEGTYRLLTEAEWEYACRAGTTAAFCYGNDLDANMANFNGNYPYGSGAKGPYRSTTVLVGSFLPNAWGLYDMHGNVYEWCQDSSGSFRIVRGGGWNNAAGYCRSAGRGGRAPGARESNTGLRLARTVPPQP